MEGPDASDRKWACVAVSNLIQNDSSTRRLLQGKNVVGALITRLTDSEDEVVLEAMGALRYFFSRPLWLGPIDEMFLLRNLCIDGGYDICAEMYNKNILTILKTFIPKVNQLMSSIYFIIAHERSSDIKHTLTIPGGSQNRPRKCPTPSVRLRRQCNHDTLVFVVGFFNALLLHAGLIISSETSNKALNAINSINLIPFLMSFLASRDKLSIAPVLAAGMHS